MKNSFILFSLLLFCLSSCSDDNLPENETIRFRFERSVPGFIVMTWQLQNGNWEEVNISDESPNLASLSTVNSTEFVHLMGSSALQYESLGDTVTTTYSMDGDFIETTIDGQDVKFLSADLEELSIPSLRIGTYLDENDSAFISSLCGSFNSCDEAGARDLFIDPGFLQDGSILYAVRVDEIYELVE